MNFELQDRLLAAQIKYNLRRAKREVVAADCSDLYRKSFCHHIDALITMLNHERMNVK